MGDIDEYDILECFSIMKDGGATDDAALEFIRQTYPQTLKNGVYSVLLQKIGKSINQAQNGVNTEQKEKVTPDAGTLQQYLDMGFTLYAQKEGFNGKVKRYPVDWRAPMTKYTKGAADDLAALQTAAELQTAINNGVILFTFRPAEKSFLILDIDRHEGKADGLNNFYKFMSEIGAQDKDAFKNIEGGSFPVYTQSAGGGYHLYFNAAMTPNLAATKSLADEVETRWGNLQLTAAGSVKHSNRYTLHGKIADAPDIPVFLLPYIQNAPKEENRKTVYQHTDRKDGYSGRPDLIEKWALESNYQNVDLNTTHGKVLAIIITCRNHGLDAQAAADICAKYNHTETPAMISNIYNGRTK
jgi:hypothetical protein